MTHVVFGAGPVGRQVALLLADRGEPVILASRSGAGPDLVGVRRQAVDAADAHAVAEATRGADVIYNCLNPPAYHRWPQLWPPMAAALLAAAERASAVLATVSNLYAYGVVAAPMVEGQPDRPAEAKGRVRADMWAEALRAHQAGRVRAVEVRASDYLGPAAQGHGPRLVSAARRGVAARPLGSADQPHTWTDVRDTARLVVAAGGDAGAWGRVWHVPSNDPRSQRQLFADLCAAAGRPAGAVRPLPAAMVKALGLASPMLRATAASLYQFTAPFVMDSTAAQAHFGLSPTPWPEVCRATVEEAAP